MKSLFKHFLVLSIAASFMFLYSCGGEDDDGEVPVADPSIRISSSQVDTITNTYTGAPGDVLYFDVLVDAPGGFNTLSIEIVRDDSIETESVGKQSQTTVFDYSYPVTHELIVEEVGVNVVYTFTAVDDAGISSAPVSVTIITESPAVTPFEEVLVGGFLNNTLGSFLDVVENTVYTSSNALANPADIDLLFYYAETPGYSIAALDNEEADASIEAQTGGDLDNFTTQNPTRFKLFMTAPDFDAITNEAQLLSAYENEASTSDQSRVTQLAADAVFGFSLAESRGSRVGLIKVISTEGTTGSDRAIRIQVLLQPEAE